MKKFRKANVISILLLSFFTLLTILITNKRPLVHEVPSELVKVKGEKKPLKLNNDLFQKRIGVSKDIWMNSGYSRVFCHLECPSSDLFFIHDGKKNSLYEKLNHYKIWIQNPQAEENSTELEYFKADYGEYNYANQSLNSNKAYVSRIKKDANSTNTFSFLANDLYISFKNFPLTFVASEFSAHLQSED
jgi:hypothetical protein